MSSAVNVVVVVLVDVGLGGRSENTKNTERYCDGIRVFAESG